MVVTVGFTRSPPAVSCGQRIWLLACEGGLIKLFGRERRLFGRECRLFGRERASWGFLLVFCTF